MDTASPAPETAYEDFSSIVLTIDHLAETEHPGGHQVHKFVASTQTLNESMLALFAYYGLTALTLEPSTIELFQQAAQPVGLPVFVLHTPENTQVVCDVDTWAVLAARFDKSVLKATEALIDMVSSNLALQKEIQGAVPTLSLLMFSAVDTDQPAATYAEAGQTERKAPAPKRSRRKVPA